MNLDPALLPDNPYLLLTPGPLSTSKTVKAAMLRDWCTWDEEYNRLVQDIRARLVALAIADTGLRTGYSAALMQGSGTFVVESVIGSSLPEHGHLLVVANGAYGLRMAAIATALRIRHTVHDSGELAVPDAQRLAEALRDDPSISHVAMVHCETTTGILNPIETLAPIVTAAGRALIVDAMSSFGGVPIDVAGLGISAVISSANKCIQGVPGFGFAVCRRDFLDSCRGRARSLSLDLYDQWRHMETGHGKWRYTSPTHVVRAFDQALRELELEGGLVARHARYAANQRRLVAGMRQLGFETLLDDRLQSPVITAFRSPAAAGYAFPALYQALKSRGFVIYPGKVSRIDTFRIGTIGEVRLGDIERLLDAVAAARTW